MADIPPISEGPGLKEQLREAIRSSGRPFRQLGRECGVGADVLSRFVRGERGISFDAAEKICRALNLRLIADPAAPPRAEPTAGPPSVAGHAGPQQPQRQPAAGAARGKGRKRRRGPEAPGE